MQYNSQRMAARQIDSNSTFSVVPETEKERPRRRINMKKLISIMLSICLMLTLGSSVCVAEKPSTIYSELAKDYMDFEGKIGIMVGTVATSEEEYRTAELWQETFGSDKVTIQNYPVNFMKEQETTISNMLSLISDPEIKAVVFCQGVPGCTAAIEKAKEKRPDILYINGAPNEDPPVTTPVADVLIDVDWIQKPITMADRAKEMGAETLVLYSFPRMQSYAKNAFSVAAVEKRCKELGIKYVYAVIPDPQSDAGQAGTQQYCIEDVPKKLEEYGPNTAFWDINLFSSVAVIKALLDAGEGIYMDSSQSSPFLGYPEAFGVEIPADKKGNAAWLIEQLRNISKNHGATGRFSVRAEPIMPNVLSVGVMYSARYLQNKTAGKFDKEVLMQCYADLTKLPIDEISFSMYDNPENGEKYDNYCMILAPWAML